MSHRHRHSRRRKHRGARSKILLGIGVIATVALIAVLSVAGYVLAIAATAPDLSELKAEDKGQLSVVYAADGSKLGFIQSDTLRRVVPWKDCRSACGGPPWRSRTSASTSTRAWTSTRSCAPGSRTSSRARRCRAAPRSPSSSCARSTSRTRSATSPARSARPSWPPSSRRSTPRPGSCASTSTRCPYGTVNGRTAIGAEAAAVTFFDKHAKGLELHEAALLAGLPQAPSEYNPFRNDQAAIERRNDVLQKMYENGYITRSEYAEAASKDLGLKRGLRYVQRREPYFFDYVQEKLIELYGLGAGARRRPAHPHHDQPQDAGPRARGDQLLLRRPGRAQLGDRLDRPGHRQDQGDGLERHLRRAPLQPRRPGPPPARLGLQDDGADRGDPQGRGPRLHLLHLQAAQHRRPRVRALGGQDLRQHLLGHR